MTATRNGQVIYKGAPTGYPEPGKHTIYDDSDTIDLENVVLKGGFLVKTLVLSLDPSIRGRMRDPKIPSYVPAYNVGAPIWNFGLSIVLRSENPSFKKGDHVYSYGTLFKEYFVVNDDFARWQVIENKEKLPWSAYVGVLGMSGQTAWMAWKEYVQAKKGDVVFVTTGAGSVGSLVIQLAKLEGLKVIGSAGSDEKVKYMKSIGADVAFNYKTTSTSEVLSKEGPINVFWDNVGGETLEAALNAAATHARFIECGMSSTYNGQTYPIKNLMSVISKRITIQGILVIDLWEKYMGRFHQELPPLIKEGRIRYIEDVNQGLESTGKGLLAMLDGSSKAKSIVVVAEE